MSSVNIPSFDITHLLAGHAIISPTACSTINIPVAGLQRNASDLIAVSTNTFTARGPKGMSLTKSSDSDEIIRPSATFSSEPDQSTNTHLGCALWLTLYMKNIISNHLKLQSKKLASKNEHRLHTLPLAVAEFSPISASCIQKTKFQIHYTQSPNIIDMFDYSSPVS